MTRSRPKAGDPAPPSVNLVARLRRTACPPELWLARLPLLAEHEGRVIALEYRKFWPASVGAVWQVAR